MTPIPHPTMPMTAFVSQGKRLISTLNAGNWRNRKVCEFCGESTNDHEYWCPRAIEERSTKRINLNPSEKEISENFFNNRCVKCGELMTIGHTHSTIELDIEQTKERE